MSDASHEQPPDAAEQIAQIEDKLSQIQAFLDDPDKWSQDIYNEVDDLTTEIRGTYLAIFANSTATAKQHQQAQVLLKESNRLHAAANTRHKQYFQKQQRTHDKDQRPDTDA